MVASSLVFPTPEWTDQLQYFLSEPRHTTDKLSRSPETFRNEVEDRETASVTVRCPKKHLPFGKYLCHTHPLPQN